MRRLAIALCHYPVLDAQGALVTTAITNLDVHDLARSARTYGCSDYFVTHPILAQRELVERILSHWREGSSGKRIPARKEALSVVRVLSSLDEAFAALGGRDAIEVWVTAAREVVAKGAGSGEGIPSRPSRVTFDEGRATLATEGKPVVIVFGTGWGLAKGVVDTADVALEPIRAAAGDYNHLSVRAACAIALDRLRR